MIPERPEVIDRRAGVNGELVLRRMGAHHEVIANGTVYLSGSWMNESAKRYSFQAEMNASNPVVTRPGRISGSSTL